MAVDVPRGVLGVASAVGLNPRLDPNKRMTENQNKISRISKTPKIMALYQVMLKGLFGAYSNRGYFRTKADCGCLQLNLFVKPSPAVTTAA